ncbi:MAG TPA: DUF2339 domain-containing protein [Terriglobales bacterium]|nr:DUF2339 domain-containing protein [Terriglobales bacterium]
MDESQAEIRELRRLVEELLARVSRLEEEAGVACNGAAAGQSEQRETGPAQLEVVAPKGPPVKTPRTPTRRNDLEARIGSQWLNRIGIIALLIGLSYFLKYAFENNWIGPAAQILIGLIAGVAVVIWSEWFRIRGYQAFSYSLKAVGIGALYLSLWAAFQVYSLLPMGVAFAAMVVVTAVTAGLAVLQNAEILAALALAGGFVTPVLISIGRNYELPLFGYLALLDVAALVMIFPRAWRRLLLLSFAGTVALYFAWYAEFYSARQFGLTFAFATLFFAIFALATLAGSGRVSIVPRSVLMVAALNGVVYFLQVYLMLESATARAWFAAVLAIVYLLLPRQRRGQERLQGTHLALAIGLITVAIALRLQEVWISLGWFVEAALLMAAGFWRGSAFVRWLALGLIAATIAKVFAYDIWDLSRGYRILSFVFLGVLLLAVSFAYQRDWLKLARTEPLSGRTSAEK